jgi:hypothetical protein
MMMHPAVIEIVDIDRKRRPQQRRQKQFDQLPAEACHHSCSHNSTTTRFYLSYTNIIPPLLPSGMLVVAATFGQ